MSTLFNSLETMEKLRITIRFLTVAFGVIITMLSVLAFVADRRIATLQKEREIAALRVLKREQRDRLLEMLKGSLKSAIEVVAMPETDRFATEIASVLNDAGWTVTQRIVVPEWRETPSPLIIIYVLGFDSPPLQATDLEKALDASGLPANLSLVRGRATETVFGAPAPIPLSSKQSLVLYVARNP